MFELANTSEFPRRTILVQNEIKHFTPVLNFFKMPDVLNSKNDHNKVACKLCGNVKSIIGNCFSNLNRHLNCECAIKDAKEW